MQEHTPQQQNQQHFVPLPQQQACPPDHLWHEEPPAKNINGMALGALFAGIAAVLMALGVKPFVIATAIGLVLSILTRKVPGKRNRLIRMFGLVLSVIGLVIFGLIMVLEFL